MTDACKRCGHSLADDHVRYGETGLLADVDEAVLLWCVECGCREELQEPAVRDGKVPRHMVRPAGEGWECVDCEQKFPVWPPDSEPCPGPKDAAQVGRHTAKQLEEIARAVGIDSDRWALREGR